VASLGRQRGVDGTSPTLMVVQSPSDVTTPSQQHLVEREGILADDPVAIGTVDDDFHLREDVARPYHEPVALRMRGLPVLRGDVENPEALLIGALADEGYWLIRVVGFNLATPLVERGER
jgi:hypothetical protein